MQVPEIDQEHCLNLLSRLIQIKSYSQTDGELEATRFMADQMRSIGLEADVFPFDEGRRLNAVGIWKGKGVAGGSQTPKTLLFNGHLDTNPVSEGWTVDPWEGKIDEEFIYGIGVSNMKSGCAAYFCAVEALLQSRWRPKGDVVLTYVVGELQGGVGTMALIDQVSMRNATGVQWALFMVLLARTWLNGGRLKLRTFAGLPGARDMLPVKPKTA
ncbi:hypothetical protein COL940_006807 [Colletotrichum noveboracense]|nr:hypothetical protein COL940_006807 [Colletotrichum noveboracense]